MSGQPTPTKMVERWANAASAPYVTDPMPVPSQIPLGFPGKASLTDGFPPLNMTPLVSGGIPPSGADMNGMGRLLSETIVAVDAGQVFYPYDAALAAAITGGYAKGSKVQDATNALLIWTAAVDGPRDPAVHPEDWVASVTLYNAMTTTGTVTNLVLPGPSDFLLDFDATAGAINIGGIVAQRDGQRLTLCKVDNSGNFVTFQAGVGTAANQLRAQGDYVMGSQYAVFSFAYNGTLGRWTPV